MNSGQRLARLLAMHLLVSAGMSSLFAWRFSYNAQAVAGHAVILAGWSLTLAIACGAFVAVRTNARWPLRAYRLLLTLTWTAQIFLYALNLISNLSWGRNITSRLVTAFAPTVWSGREPFPVGPLGIVVFACGTLLTMAAVVAWRSRSIDAGLRDWVVHVDGRLKAAPTHVRRALLAVVAVAMSASFAAMLHWAIESRDNRLWKDELVASFFRPVGFAFEPTARREAVAERDAVLRASYPRGIPTANRKHVIVIMVDSLRADRMQAYGYHRPTTPFLDRMVRSGRMKRVEAAFSTCSESFCGITSTLAGREFRDISARTFQLQDVLADEGYQTWFLLSGNHSAWNGLPQFYHSSEETFFDGTQTERYTMDDDRLVLEGLERVPPASRDRPAFFYIHLMSTHYLGVQLPDSHVFTSPDDQVSPGLEPYKILDQLNKPDRYDDKVRQVDGLIQQLFEALAAKHYLDDAIVVVTSDHGEGLGERHWAHGWHLYNEDIRIPMLLYDVPQARYPDLTFATQIDIAPTIVDRLGLPIPASWEGQSLLSPTRRRFTYHQTYFLPNRFAVLYRNENTLFKFIATPQYGEEELYDLTRDRGEVRNLVEERPELAALLRGKVREYREEVP
jgi:glucan phosphoethanolaminetransferase (alkaline phosphatase superfamily)